MESYKCLTEGRPWGNGNSKGRRNQVVLLSKFIIFDNYFLKTVVLNYDMISLKMKIRSWWATKIAQWVKVQTTKVKILSSIPSFNLVDGENQFTHILYFYYM